MHPRQVRFSPTPLLALLMLLCMSNGMAQADSETDVQPGQAASQLETDPATSTETASDSEQRLSLFESLRAGHLQALRNIAALEDDATNAVGEDEIALQRQIVKLTLEFPDTFGEMWRLIEKMEAAGEDASIQRQALLGLLPTLRDFVQTDYSREVQALEALKKDEAGLTDGDSIAALGLRIKRKEELLLRVLDAGIDAADLSASLGVMSDAERQWLGRRIMRRARLAMSHVSLASQRVTDVETLLASATDPSALQPFEAAANARYAAALQSLATVTDLMERLDIESSDYRQLLVESTGEITVDAIDSEVVSELANRWTQDLRESVTTNGGRYAFQVFLFLLVVGIFWGISRLVRKLVTRAVEAPHLRFSQLLKRMLVSLSTSAVIVMGLLIALSQVGIEVAPMLAGLGIVGFVLGFALQDTLGNFAAGVMILIYRPFDVGDMIDCAGGVFGQVSHMSLVSTTILTIDNKTLIVPNNKIWGDVITNVTAQAIRRIDLEFGIGYGDDIPHAEEVLWSIIKDHPKVLADPEPVVKVHSLGDSSVNFVVRPWVARDDYWDVHWDFMREVKLRFDREGVSIPFPQRDVHFYRTDLPDDSAEGSSVEPPVPMEVSSTPLRAGDEPEA